MKTTVLKILGFSAFLVTLNYPAQAYNALCDKIGDTVRRDLCRCRSDAGAKVSYRPDTSGQIKVREGDVPNRKLGQVNECMQTKGHKV